MNITQKHYSFCAYRLPGADVVRLRRGVTRKGFHPGFVIAPFDMSGNVYTISDTEETSWSEISNILHTADFGVAEYPFPEVSTSKVEHADEVAGIKNFISGNHDKKVIASRIILKNDSIDIKRSFLNLERAYPQAFVFLFFSPETGGWIGASPELLLESNNSELSTYALAGTRPAGTDAAWDEKNLKEQRIVCNYIVDVFKSNGLTPICSGIETKEAGNVEHLLNKISASRQSTTDVDKLLINLSPTPALSGYPKEEAMKLISEIERQPRGFYGGFIGPYDNDEDFTFFVNLRSIRFTDNGYYMQVGGGITALSNPDDEWMETENKSLSILRKLILSGDKQ